MRLPTGLLGKTGEIMKKKRGGISVVVSSPDGSLYFKAADCEIKRTILPFEHDCCFGSAAI